ncbi:hypothetical protein BC829DRAFT_441894 [Chytridium lagenaria]|nr:hypothetical protein BC829DRAFT_441894 [Chytridium lagenaria]
MSSTPTQDVPSPSGVNSPIITSAAAASTKQKKRAVAPLKVAKDPSIKTSKAKGANFSLAESKELIQIVKNELPKGQMGWMKVASVFNRRHSSDRQREWDALRNRFMSIRNTTRKLTANITQELRDEANEVSKILEKDAGIVTGGGPAPLTEDEEGRLLPIIENMLPVSEREWNEVAAEFNDGLPIEDHRSAELIKSHFDSLHSVRKPTGDPDCPANVRWCKRINRQIQERVSGGDGPPDDNESEQEEDEDVFENAAPHDGLLLGEDVDDEDWDAVDEVGLEQDVDFDENGLAGRIESQKENMDLAGKKSGRPGTPNIRDVNIPLNNDHQTPVRGENRTMKRKLDDSNKKILSSPTFSVATRLGAQGIRPNNPISKEASDYKSQKAQKRSRISSAVTSVVDSTSAITELIKMKEEQEQERKEEKALRFHELELKRIEVEMLRLQADERAEERRLEEQRRRDEADQRAEERRLNDEARRDKQDQLMAMIFASIAGKLDIPSLNVMAREK